MADLPTLAHLKESALQSAVPEVTMLSLLCDIHLYNTTPLYNVLSYSVRKAKQLPTSLGSWYKIEWLDGSDLKKTRRAEGQISISILL